MTKRNILRNLLIAAGLIALGIAYLLVMKDATVLVLFSVFAFAAVFA